MDNKSYTITNTFDKFCSMTVNDIARECNRTTCDECRWQNGDKCLWEAMPCFWKTDYLNDLSE